MIKSVGNCSKDQKRLQKLPNPISRMLKDARYRPAIVKSKLVYNRKRLPKLQTLGATRCRTVYNQVYIDSSIPSCYYMTMMKKRKSRSDRKHVIYSLSVNDMEYIGVTYVERSAVSKSIIRRWQKHVRRALTENKNWTLCKAIRKYGPEAFELHYYEVIRGKAEAHIRERELIRELSPKLNSDVR